MTKPSGAAHARSVSGTHFCRRLPLGLRTCSSIIVCTIPMASVTDSVTRSSWGSRISVRMSVIRSSCSFNRPSTCRSATRAPATAAGTAATAAIDQRSHGRVNGSTGRQSWHASTPHIGIRNIGVAASVQLRAMRPCMRHEPSTRATRHAQHVAAAHANSDVTVHTRTQTANSSTNSNA